MEQTRQHLVDRICLEQKVVPLHLRGTELSRACIEHALDLIDGSGILHLSTLSERTVSGVKMREMLKYAARSGLFDFESLRITPSEGERGARLYGALDWIARGVGRAYSTHTTHTGEEFAIEDTIHYCRSLLWLCNVGLLLNNDLYNDMFGVSK